jgi:hypothetical protein
VVSRDFGRLSAAARQAIPFIEGGVSRGLSGNTILTSLRATGSGARRRDVQAIVRGIKGQQRAGLRVANIRRDFRPDPARIDVSKHQKMRNEFTFKVEVSGRDMAGNKIKTGIMVTTDELHTRGWIEDKATELLKDENRDYGIEVESVLIKTAIRMGGAFELGD